MGRPAKTLAQLVRDGSFRGRRDSHRDLLSGPVVQWPAFASLQARFAGAGSEAERREIALSFERMVREAQQELQRRIDGNGGGKTAAAAELAAALAELGRPGSLAQLLRFFPAYLVHPKGPLFGQPFKLAAFQRQFLREFYRRDKKGRRVYRFGVLGVPRGNGKTPLAAGLGLYELLSRRDAPEVYCAAGSKEQAGIALGFAKSFVEMGDLADWIQLKSGLRCPASSGSMQVVSSEGRLQHGRMPAAALIDELWAFETRREIETYTAFSSALHKREDAFLLAITTAGYDKTSLLGRIYDGALAWPQIEQHNDDYLTVAKDLEHGQLLWWYGAPEGATLDDPQVWRKANPASWIKTSELKRQLADPGLDENEFRRLNLNMWTHVRDAWLPDGCWQQLATDHTIPKKAPVYVGVDVGLVHDSTAVVWAHKLEDGRILLNAHVWSADPDAPAHTHCRGGRVELEQVEQFILQLADDYKVKEVAYDPHFFQRSAELLERSRKRLRMVEFLQASGPMADAYQGFYQAALEGRLAHNNDPILNDHIHSTVGVMSERGWKLRKLNKQRRMDATIAACLATSRAQHHRSGAKPNIYWIEDDTLDD
jgi:phage terminase large subunit-like protein